MFKVSTIPIILLAIFICSIFSRAIMKIFLFLYNISWNQYNNNKDSYIFKAVWLIFSIFLLLFIHKICIFIIIPIILQ